MTAARINGRDIPTGQVMGFTLKDNNVEPRPKEPGMTEEIPIGKSQSIRSCGYDEFWLQDQIADNPSCLQLGDLEVIFRERKQASGGRLDILLKDPEDDSMYEVEVMLGETNESHIIRTIEYWDNEKRGSGRRDSILQSWWLKPSLDASLTSSSS